MAVETNEDLGRSFSAAELGALAHLYRAEVYRSTLWRTRLDTTTNWSVVTLGIAISVSFSSTDAPSLPLLLVGFLIVFFLTLEARRYRYFNVWRARARWFETRFYAPMLKHGKLDDGSHWQNVLARDYESPRYHISYLRAVGRRLRRSYLWIILIQSVAYVGKIIAHPGPPESAAEFFARANVGPLSGEVVMFVGFGYLALAIGLALLTLYLDRVTHAGEKSTVAGG